MGVLKGKEMDLEFVEYGTTCPAELLSKAPLAPPLQSQREGCLVGSFLATRYHRKESLNAVWVNYIWSYPGKRKPENLAG